MGQELAERMRVQYPELAAHFGVYDHTTVLGAEARRLLDLIGQDAPLPFPASAASVSFFRRAREREITDALRAARRGRA
jgi:hypothetical protein